MLPGTVCTYKKHMTNFKFNVAQLLREAVGGRRDYTFSAEQVTLDETLVLRDIAGDVRFTRTTTGVFAQIRAQGLVRMICVRSLEEFDQHIELDIGEEIHSVIDVITGAPVSKPAEDDCFFLNELHLADIGEIIREYTLLQLPLNPVSEAYRDMPVRYTVQSEGIQEPTEADESVDERLEVLKVWLERQNAQPEIADTDTEL